MILQSANVLVVATLALVFGVAFAKDTGGKAEDSNVVEPAEVVTSGRVDILTGRDVEKLCEPFEYCQGSRFSATVNVQGKTVTCNQVPDPRNRCCLPSEAHLVCYNIQVDGLFLSFDQSNPAGSTDFAQFCQLMLEAEGQDSGKYSSITKDTSIGQIVYRYNDWASAPASSGNKEQEYHIRDLSCGITEKPKKS